MDNHGHRSDKRLAILEAALELIGEKGFHAAPTSEIAERAGVGVGSLYRYFKDKDDLIQQLFAYVTKRSSREILEGCDPEAPIRQRYIRLCHNIMAHLVRQPTTFRFLEQFFSSPHGVCQRREKLIDADDQGLPENPLDEVLRAAKAQQIVKDLPLSTIRALTFGPMMFHVRDVHAGLAVFEPEAAGALVEGCWDAVKR